MKMFFSYVQVVSILLVSTIIRGENPQKLFMMMVEHGMACLAETPDDFSMGVCQEMFKDGNDNSLKKYESCKCLATCTVKKFEMITEQDKVNKEKLKYYASLVDFEPWDKQAKMVYEECKNVTGAGCELGYNLISCALHKSPDTLSLVRNFTEQSDSMTTQ